MLASPHFNACNLACSYSRERKRAIILKHARMGNGVHAVRLAMLYLRLTILFTPRRTSVVVLVVVAGGCVLESVMWLGRVLHDTLTKVINMGGVMVSWWLGD